MFGSMGQTNVKNLGNGGTMDGDVTITGDLTVSGGIGLTLSEVIEGTSTIDVKWENLDYDYLWTCNDFFLSDRINKAKVDLVTVAYNTNLYDKKLCAFR